MSLIRGASPATGWSRLSPSPSSSPVHFFLALPQQRLDELDRLFWAVSEPTSERYGEFLTTEQIQAIVSPPHAHRQRVVEYLVARGVERRSILDYGDSLEVDTDVRVASRLFDAAFHVFEHSDSGRRVVRALGDVSVEQELGGLIDMVYGLTGFPVPHLSNHVKAYGGGEGGHNVGQRGVENDAIIPQTLYEMYGLPRNTTVGTSSGISQGVIEWEGESFAPLDLALYAGNVSLNGNPVYPAAQIIGPNDVKEPGGESTLDVDMIVGVAPGNSNWFWLEGNRTAWLYSFAVHFLNASTVPDVISVSYGWYEGEQCDDGIGSAECAELNVTSSQFVQRMNTEWQKIGLRGVSVIVSSGDSGCHTRSDPYCTRPILLADYVSTTTHNTARRNGCTPTLDPHPLPLLLCFAVPQPASSPFITSVGATEVGNATYFATSEVYMCRNRTGRLASQQLLCVSGGIEVAVDVQRAYFTSGGGFSNISMSAPYQADAVARYLAQTEVPLPPASMFNAQGRGYPDVSSVGHNGYTIQFGREVLSGGTSQSSPIFAGVIALLNVRFKKLTGNTLGFINPLRTHHTHTHTDTQLAHVTSTPAPLTALAHTLPSPHAQPPLCPYPPPCVVWLCSVQDVGRQPCRVQRRGDRQQHLHRGGLCEELQRVHGGVRVGPGDRAGLPQLPLHAELHRTGGQRGGGQEGGQGGQGRKEEQPRTQDDAPTRRVEEVRAHVSRGWVDEDGKGGGRAAIDESRVSGGSVSVWDEWCCVCMWWLL